jgi:hypothetical protein
MVIFEKYGNTEEKDELSYSTVMSQAQTLSTFGMNYILNKDANAFFCCSVESARTF